MAENLGAKFTIDISNLKAGLQQANRLIRESESEFKAAASGMGDWQNTSEGLNAKLKQLTTTSDLQREKVRALKEEYQRLVDEGMDETSAKAVSMRTDINKATADLNKTEKQIDETKKALDELGNEADESGKSLGDAAKGGISSMTVALGNLVSKGIEAAIRGLKNLATEAFNAGASFEAAMSQVQAISGASGEEMDLLTEKAKEMGEKTKFSASQSAEAFNYMAMAGWKTEDMLNGIEGIMNLAAASGSDLATTSDIVTDALTAMGYSAGDAGRLADVMAAASSNANTNVEMMGATFQYAAPIVGALGYSMEDTAVAIGLMANAGIKGEKAGTALRSTLTRLSAPPKEAADAMAALNISLTDNEGQMKEMNEVVDDLRKAFANLSETEQTQYAKQLAGQEAMSGLLAIVRAAPEDYEKLTKAVEGSTGAAQEMANVMQDNVSGQITLLKSKIEGIMIKVFEKMSKSIRKALDTVSKALDKVDWDSFAKSAGKAAEAVANLFAFVVKNAGQIMAVLKGIAVAFVTYKAVATITAVTTAFKKLITAVKAGQTIMQALNMTMAANPIGLVAAAVAGLTAGLIALYKAQEKAIEAEYGLKAAQQETLDKVQEMTDKYNELNTARNEQVDGVKAEYDYLADLKDEYNSLIDANGKVKEGYEDRANFIISTLAKAMGLEEDEIRKLIQKNGELSDSIDQIILKKQAEATLLANEDLYNEAIKNRGTALNELTEAQNTLSEIEQKYIENSAAYESVMKTYNDLLNTNALVASGYYFANKDVIDGQKILSEAFVDAKQKVKDAEGAWVGYNSTIQNYENLSAAIISGDSQKIGEALTNMQYNFITAETGTKESLERQLENLKTNYENMRLAIQNNTPGITQDMLLQAQSMVNAAQGELDKFEESAPKSGTRAGGGFAQYLAATKGIVFKAGQDLALNAESGTDSAKSKLETVGTIAGNKFVTGLDTNKTNANSKGKELATEAKKGAESENGEQGGAKKAGSDFGSGFLSGIGNWIKSAWDKGWELAKNALAGAKAGQKSNSPAKETIKLGNYFGEGYEEGISAMLKPVTNAAEKLAKEAVNALDHTLGNQIYDIGKANGQSLISGLNSADISGLNNKLSSVNSTVSGNAQAASNSQVVINQTNNYSAAHSRFELYKSKKNTAAAVKLALMEG